MTRPRERPPQPEMPDLHGALCAEEGRDPEMWFDPRREGEAVAVCCACPARPRCLLFALKAPVAGVWGAAPEWARTLPSTGGLEDNSAASARHLHEDYS
jgi:hypothetical protein